MGNKTRRLQFEGAAPAGAIRILSDRIDAVSLADKPTIVVNLARVMTFRDPYYGKVELTRKKFQQMIKNFDADTFGQEIFIDVSHNPSDGAAAKMQRIFMDGLRFMAEVTFTEFGVDAVKNRGFKYLSIDFTENYTDPETEKEHGPLLFGAGLTIRPRVKRLNPVTLSFDKADQPMLLSLHAKHLLTEEHTMKWSELIKKLQEQLSGLKLSDDVIEQYAKQFESTGKALGDNEEAVQALMDGFVATAKVLSESGQGTHESIRLDFSGLQLPAVGGVDADAVRTILAEQQQADENHARQLAESRDENVKLFTAALDAADGISDDVRTTLAEAGDLITADMTAEQVTALATQQLKLGHAMSTQAQLANLGYPARGNARISVDESNNSKALQEEINGILKKSNLHASGSLLLSENESPFAGLVLSEFDRMNAGKIAAERKMLAGGSTGIGDTDLPVGFQRTVIREALSDLRVLELVQTLTDFSATATTQIPYEQRDMSAVQNNGIVFEGQGIHRASVTQAMDLAYILPMKLAFIISNEVMHFSRASGIDWDAYARNVESNARVLRELIVLRICNELQRSADTYLAGTISNENLDAQLTGSASTIKTAQFPIVRPHQQYDLQGNAIGTAENAMIVRLNGVAIGEYDGTGNQGAGTYYRVTNYNLGYVQFVNQAGTPVTPSSTANPDDISYSYATNVAKFDLDNGTVDLDKHLNGLLRAIGARKAVLAQDRYSLPNFLLMSHVLHDTVTNADQFSASGTKSGSGLDMTGDLEQVKGTPAWATNAPNVDLGDERILLGQRGTLTYTVAKPFQTGTPFEAVDSAGQPTGQKQAYGEEYSAIKVPVPIRNRMTSVLAYSFTGR